MEWGNLRMFEIWDVIREHLATGTCEYWILPYAYDDLPFIPQISLRLPVPLETHRYPVAKLQQERKLVLSNTWCCIKHVYHLGALADSNDVKCLRHHLYTMQYHCWWLPVTSRGRPFISSKGLIVQGLAEPLDLPQRYCTTPTPNNESYSKLSLNTESHCTSTRIHMGWGAQFEFYSTQNIVKHLQYTSRNEHPWS